MTTGDPDGPSGAGAKVAPETLELRARPQPVTRINRKVLIGGAAVPQPMRSASSTTTA